MGEEAEQGHQGEKEAEELLNQMGMAVVVAVAVEVEVALSHTVMEEQEVVVAEEMTQSAPAGEDEPSQFLP